MTTIKTEKVNNFNVVPVDLPSQRKPDNSVFNDLYPNIFLVAKKASGKSQLIFNLIQLFIKPQKKIKKNMVIFIFCSTINKDATYKVIQEYLEKNKVNSFLFDSLDDENGFDNALNTIAESEKIDKEQLTDEILEADGSNYDNGLFFKKKKKKKPKPPPEYLFIFDDLSNELKDPRLVAFLKKNRHYKANVILSSQYVHDLPKTAKANIDAWCLFPHLPETTIRSIYEATDIDLSYDRFIDLYEFATKEKYNFLFVDRNKPEYRKNLNLRLTP